MPGSQDDQEALGMLTCTLHQNNSTHVCVHTGLIGLHVHRHHMDALCVGVAVQISSVWLAGCLGSHLTPNVRMHDRVDGPATDATSCCS